MFLPGSAFVTKSLRYLLGLAKRGSEAERAKSSAPGRWVKKSKLLAAGARAEVKRDIWVSRYLQALSERME